MATIGNTWSEFPPIATPNIHEHLYPLLVLYTITVVLFLSAYMIDVRSLVEMFFKADLPSSSVLFLNKAFVTPADWKKFRTVNWFTSQVHTGATSYALAVFFHTGTVAGWAIIISLLSFAYLLAIFLLNIVPTPAGGCEDKTEHPKQAEEKRLLWYGMWTGPLICYFLAQLREVVHVPLRVLGSFITAYIYVFIVLVLLLVAFAIGHVMGSKVTPLAKRGLSEVRPDYVKKDFPAPFPNGWYVVATSSDIKVGDVRPVTLCGRDLVVFRGSNGAAGVLDAYCPHMGAHLGAGGKVIGNLLQCRFHGWSFDTEGECKHIPYTTSKIPKTARVRSYPMREKYGLIAVWFHVDNESPPYELMDLPELDGDDAMVFRGRRVLGDVKMHIQEFGENSADTAHFNELHDSFPLPWVGRFIRIAHKTGWERDKTFPHVSYFYDTAHLKFLGTDIKNSDAESKITFDGPGGLVYFRFYTRFGNIFLFKLLTPTTPFTVYVEDIWYAPKNVNPLLVRYVVMNFCWAFDDDVLVWEHKAWVHKPMLVSGDGPNGAQRRWFKQFYTEDAQKKQQEKEDRCLANNDQLEW